jgi:hypothetical protein
MKLEMLPRHHAVLIVSPERVAIHGTLWEEIETVTAPHRLFAPTVLDIDTAREVIRWAQTPFAGEKIAIISFHTASVPAQNALLKILEEPSQNVRFILVTSNKEQLLHTLRSRTSLVEHLAQMSSTRKDAEEFLVTLPIKRMELKCVKDLLAKVDEEERKDRESVRSFILSLIPVLEDHIPYPHKVLQEVLTCASYAGDASSSGKAIIEYLALLLPHIHA